MSTVSFSRYVLRTTNVDAAHVFYDAVLGQRGDGIFQLHEAALARGARPHWLGLLGVHELGGFEAMVARFVERGATRLGPAPAVGADFAVLRDPGGALLGLTDSMASSAASVVWHQLNTHDRARAVENYTTLFGWSPTGEIALGELGRHQRFAFGVGAPSVGVISDIEGRPEVHPHWLYFFTVPSLDRAVDQVKRRGGLVAGPLLLPNGVRVAACDDPQGAAFGIVEAVDAAKLAT